MKKWWVAFTLNILFAFLEIIGGIVSGSTAILADAVHDMGDSAVIGLSIFWETKNNPRYALISAAINALVLIIGSVSVLILATIRLFNPVTVHNNAMMLLAVVGLCINGTATILTRRGKTTGQKIINLHLLEDVLSWAAVLVGALVIRLTGFSVIDPLLSMAVSLFVLIHATEHLKEAVSALRG